MSKRRKYSDEFKREAGQLTYHPGVSKSQIAQELGSNANMPGRWCRECQAGGSQVFPRLQGRPGFDDFHHIEEYMLHLDKVKTSFFNVLDRLPIH